MPNFGKIRHNMWPVKSFSSFDKIQYDRKSKKAEVDIMGCIELDLIQGIA